MGNSGYNLTSACPDMHAAYDRCEASHLDSFRKGEASIDNPCRDEWEDYKQCVMEVWDAKTQDYLARRAAARGDTASPTQQQQPPSAANTASSSFSAADSPSSSSATAASTEFFASDETASSNLRSTTQR